jgi:hypothetical protein
LRAPRRNRDPSGWSREFDEPIMLPDGRRLTVLRTLRPTCCPCPPKERQLPEWQAAIEAMMLVCELDGPTMFARIGVMRALIR